MGADRKKLTICGGVLLTLGAIILVVLVYFGSAINTQIQAVPITLLKYSLPSGYAKNPDFTECKTETDGNIWNEYYMYNLTNLNATLNGEDAVFEVVGPYVLAHWKCQFDKSVTNKVLQWREYDEGWRFIAKDSKGSLEDKITNFNPAYIAILDETRGEDGLLVSFASTAINQFIEGLQTTEFYAGTTSGVLSGIKAVAVTSSNTIGAATAIVNSAYVSAVVGLGGNASINAFFNNRLQSFAGPGGSGPYTFYSFANYTGQDDLFTADEAYSLFHGLFDNQATGLLTALGTYAAGYPPFASYGISNTTLEQDLLGYITGYLMNAASIIPVASQIPGVTNQLFYAQWAQCASGSPTEFPGVSGPANFEVVPCGTQSNVTLTEATHLWEDSKSFTTTAGLALWLNFSNNPTAVFAAFPNVTSESIIATATWLGTFALTETPKLLKAQYQLTDLKDLAYLQFGQLSLGFSLKTVVNLPFYPEIYNPAAGFNVKFDLNTTKALLNGTYGITQPANLGLLLGLLAAGKVAQVEQLWGLSQDQIGVLGQLWYPQLAVGLNNAYVKPLTQTGSSGLFVTRSVSDWLFYGQDPMLTLLGQPSSSIALLGNKTTTLAQQRALPIKASNKQRVFTGGSLDDVHYSLMPVDDGSQITWWAQNITKSGYAGSQFVPYDDVKNSKYPFVLNLYRQAPLEYVGSGSFKGIATAQVILSDKTFAPNATYFNEYQGLAYVGTVPDFSGAPLWLSKPNFAGCEAAVTAHISIVDNIFPAYDASDKLSTHRFAQYFSVHSFLGTALKVNLPFQGSVHYNSTAKVNYAGVKPMFAPLFWNAQGGEATDAQAAQLAAITQGVILSKVLIAIGAAVGAVLIFAGVYYIFKARRATAVIAIK